jgi:tetratricopeptide (TPR) repeat protein
LEAPVTKVCIVLLAAAMFGPASRAESKAPTPEAATAAYDEGRYQDALEMLKSLDAKGDLPGSLLYRLFFSLRVAGDQVGSAQALGRATQALESESAAAGSLETSFYLANAYGNVGRAADARKVAAEATRRVESKEWPEPKTAIQTFQLGKLYQDQGRTKDATAWYGRALDGFDPASPRFAANARWARRYLAESALSAADFPAAEKHYTALVQAGGVGVDEYGALALARTRIGKYTEAASAWEEIVRLDPANGDDARYSARLARMAADVASIPAIAPAGKPFSSLSKEDLEAVLADQVKRARELRAEATDSPVSLEASAKQRIQDGLLTAKSVFLAAGLEYATRRFPIRETAFTQGYAVFFFQPEQWELP